MTGPVISGRAARRREQFGPEGRKRGAGWTRKLRKGREKRLATPPEAEKESSS